MTLVRVRADMAMPPAVEQRFELVEAAGPPTYLQRERGWYPGHTRSTRGWDCLSQGSAEVQQSDGRPRVAEVLYVDDLAVLESERLRPAVALSLAVSSPCHCSPVRARQDAAAPR